MSDLNFDHDEIHILSQKLSASLSTAVFAFIVFSGVHFIYFFYNNGELIDEFYDQPDKGYKFGFKSANKAVMERFKGQPEKLLLYCLSSTSLESLSHILNSCREGKKVLLVYLLVITLIYFLFNYLKKCFNLF